MQIKRLQLKEFKKFADFETEFSGGLNVVRGENEQGKSTIVSAILAGLFYDPTKRNKAIEGLKRWGSEELYRIDMTLEGSGITYELQKDFEQKYFSLKDTTSGKEWTTVEEARPVIGELLGTTDPKLFLSTAAVRQDAMSSIHEGKKELEQAIQQFVTSGGDDTSAVDVLRLLEKKLRDAEKGLDRPASNPGVLKQLTERKGALEAKIAELQVVVDDRAKRQKENEELRQQLRVQKEEQEVRVNMLNTAKERRELQQQRVALEQQFEQAERVREALDRQSGGPQEVERVTEELKRVEELAAQVRDLEVQRAALAKRITALDVLEEMHEPNPLLNPGMLGGLLLTAVAVGGFVFSPWTLTALVPAVPLFIWAFQKRRNTKLKKQEEQQEEGLRTEDSALQVQQQELLQKASVGTVDQLLQTKDRLTQERETLLKAQGEMEALLKGKTAEQARTERTDIAKQLATLEAREAELEGVTLDSREEAKLEAEAAKAEKVIKEQTERGIENRAKIEATPASNDELLQLQEELETVNEDLRREQLLADAHRLAIDVISKSKDAVTKQAKDVLQELMNEYLPRITKDRYTAAHVDDSLNITVETGEQNGGEVTPDGVLSAGTVDQVYLIARLALMRLLYKDARPPLILDDPFVAFDDVRKAMTMGILGELAQEQQILLFTHSPSYDGWASTVVELGAVK